MMRSCYYVARYREDSVILQIVVHYLATHEKLTILLYITASEVNSLLFHHIEDVRYKQKIAENISDAVFSLMSHCYPIEQLLDAQRYSDSAVLWKSSAIERYALTAMH